MRLAAIITACLLRCLWALTGPEVRRKASDLLELVSAAVEFCHWDVAEERFRQLERLRWDPVHGSLLPASLLETVDNGFAAAAAARRNRPSAFADAASSSYVTVRQDGIQGELEVAWRADGPYILTEHIPGMSGSGASSSGPDTTRLESGCPPPNIGWQSTDQESMKDVAWSDPDVRGERSAEEGCL